ncbi:MAG: hypothetical protein KBS66_03570, partial [Eubacterium sp.]|nr:hypothetical protein [Candidatus Colimonas fimequi]
GSDRVTIGPDSIKIKDAVGYEDGSSPFKFDEKGAYTAFANYNQFDVYVFTESGKIVYRSAYDEPLDLSTLNPGEYIIGVDSRYTTVDVFGHMSTSWFYNIKDPRSRLIVHGNTYKVSAYGEKVNGRYAGTVALVSPDKLDEVTNAKYQGGTSLTFKAYPTTNYALKYWLITESGQEKIVEAESDLLTYKVQGTEPDITIKAVFALKENRISSHVLGGGTDSKVTCTSDKLDVDQIVAQGKELTFEAKAGAGYEFVEWRYVTVDGKTTIKAGDTAEDKSVSTAKFTMGSASATVYAVFQRQKTQMELPEHVRAYYLNTEEINPFIADGVEVAVASDNMVPVGATAILRPESGYKASGEWSVDGVESDAIRKIEGGSAIRFVVPSGVDVIKVNVTCQPGRFGITANSKDSSADIDILVNGKTAESLDDVTGGAAVEFTAKPHRGYVFKKWIVNGDEVSATSPMYATLVTANMDVEAVCEKVDGYKVKANIEGEGKASYEITTESGLSVTGQLSKEASEIELFDGESITFNAAADDSFMPSYIVRDNKRTEHSSNTYTISKLTEDTSLTIGFEPAVFYSVNIENHTKYQLQSGDGAKLDKRITVGSLEDAVILIKNVTNPDKLFVTIGAETL